MARGWALDPPKLPAMQHAQAELAGSVILDRRGRKPVLGGRRDPGPRRTPWRIGSPGALARPHPGLARRRYSNAPLVRDPDEPTGLCGNRRLSSDPSAPGASIRTTCRGRSRGRRFQTGQIDFTQSGLCRHGASFRRGAKPAYRFDETLQHALAVFVQLSQPQLPGDVAGVRQFAKYLRRLGETTVAQRHARRALASIRALCGKRLCQSRADPQRLSLLRFLTSPPKQYGGDLAIWTSWCALNGIHLRNHEIIRGDRVSSALHAIAPTREPATPPRNARLRPFDRRTTLQQGPTVPATCVLPTLF
jgi:hypothetical protein